MKLVGLIRYLVLEGCFLLREGAKHSVFFNPAKKLTSNVPRHGDIDSFLARKICDFKNRSPTPKSDFGFKSSKRLV